MPAKFTVTGDLNDLLGAIPSRLAAFVVLENVAGLSGAETFGRNATFTVTNGELSIELPAHNPTVLPYDEDHPHGFTLYVANWKWTFAALPVGGTLDLDGVTDLDLEPLSTTDQVTISNIVAQLINQGDASAAGAALNAAIDAGLVNTPSIEETSSSVILDYASVNATRTQPVYVAPFSCMVEQASLVFTDAVVASNTNYWTVVLLRYRAGVSETIAVKTTKTPVSGGEGITAFVEWHFDLSPFANNGFVKGDVLGVAMIPTGSPSALVNPCLTFRAPAADVDAEDPAVVLVSDAFTRADTTSGLGVADSGQTWVTSGSWGISSNQAYCPVPTAGDFAQIETGQSDVVVQAKFPASGGSWGLRARVAADSLTCFQASPTNLFHFTSPGTNANLGAFPNAFVAGDSMRIRCEGSTITVYRDAGSIGVWVQALQVTDARNLTATRHGMRSSTNTGAATRMDNFLVTTL